jgi:hypothetical protein
MYIALIADNLISLLVHSAILLELVTHASELLVIDVIR